MELTFESAFSPGGLVGNLSYVLLIVSMAMRNIFWLRVLAILSGIFGIAYDVVWLSDPVGTFWESAFTLVNLVQWLWLVYENKRVQLTPEQAELHNAVFPVLTRQEFLKLFALAEQRSFSYGETLLEKDKAVDRLFLLRKGRAAVIVGDMEISDCEPGDFVGEIGFFNHTPASATVATLSRTDCLVFDCRNLRAVLERNAQLERGFSFALNANLAAKLIRNNQVGLNV